MVQINTFEFGSFTLNPNTVRLTALGQTVEIEPQAFETLLLLIENRERVITKQELLEVIWHGRVVSDQVITRIIYELRKTLDDKDQQDSHIRTVRGKGYQFIAEVFERPLKSTSIGTTKTIINRTFSWRGKSLWLLMVMSLTAFSYLVIHQYYKPPSGNNLKLPNSQKVYPIVAVLPINIEQGNEEKSILVQSLVDYLTYQLQQNLNMKVIHPDSLINMQGQMNDLYAIQQATRSDFMIKSFIESVTDQRINLHLILYKNNGVQELTPFPLGAFEFAYPENTKELNDLYKQRKITVRSIVKIIEPSMTVNDDGSFETADPEVMTVETCRALNSCYSRQSTEMASLSMLICSYSLIIINVCGFVVSQLIFIKRGLKWQQSLID